MPARYLRHLAIERQPQAYALTFAAATLSGAIALKRAQKPLLAATTTVAAISLLKAHLLTIAAATVVVASLRRQVSIARTAVSHVQAGVAKLVRLVRSAATAVAGLFVQGPNPVIVSVTVAPAVYVQVTAGPL